jgi:RHS repeat-associated protein
MKKYKRFFNAIFSLSVLLWMSSVQTTNAQSINRVNISGPGNLMVNSFTGNLFTERSDLSIPYRNLNIDFSFSYNSSNFNTNRGYGRGWTFSYDLNYRIDSTDFIISWGDGREDIYRPDSLDNNIVKAPAGIFDSLSQYQTGKYVVVTPYGIKYFFDDANTKRITKIQDRNNNQLLFTYTDTLLTTLTDGAGRAIQLQYNSGRLTSISDNLVAPARIISYEYDGYGNMVKMTDPSGNSISYDYIINGPLSKVTDKNENVVDVLYTPNFAVKEIISCALRKTFTYNNSTFSTYVTDYLGGGNNQISIFRYSPGGNLIKKEGNCCGYNITYEYNENNNISKITDANGNVTEYTYNAKGNMLSKKDPAGNTSFYTYNSSFSQLSSYTDRNGGSMSFTYDPQGNLTGAAYPLNISNSFTYSENGELLSSTDGNNRTTTYDYDNYGNLSAIHKPLGVEETFTYDLRGRLLNYRDPNNNTTAFNYDPMDRLLNVTDALSHVTAFTYDAKSNLLTSTDRNNRVTTYAYDAMDLPVMIKDALNHTSVMEYDGLGNIVAVFDPNGNADRYTYDNLNRLIKEKNGAGEVITYDYDASGNLTGIVLPNGNTINVTYDALHRLAQAKDNLGTFLTHSYDRVGNLLSRTDANGNSVSFTYDALNRKITDSDALFNAVEYTYDGNFNLTTIKDRNNKIRSFSYDDLNRRTQYTDALNHSTNFNYDPAGNLLSVKDANNNQTSYIYDALNRHTQITFANGTTNGIAYDNEGLLLNFTDNNGAVTNYGYDAAYNLISKNYPGSNDDVFAYDAAGRIVSANNSNATVALTYDAANRLTSETLNGKTTSYAYSIPDNKITTNYPGGRTLIHDYDIRNRLGEIKEGNNTMASFAYDNADRMLSKNYPLNGTTTSYAYDANNRITSVLTNPGGKLNSIFSYDNNGNKLFEKKLHKPEQSEQYAYDDEMRLTDFKSGILSGNSIPSPLNEIDYNYDALGNRTSVTENGVSTNYAANNVNAYTQISSAVPLTYQYDNNGNLLNDGVHSYSYDSQNHLIAVDNGNTSTYKYDALGRRIEKVVGTETTQYLYSGVNEIENRDGTGNITASFVFQSGIDDVISSRINGADYFYYNNVLGSVNAIANTSGTVVDRYEYDPFGGQSLFDGNYTPAGSSAIGNDITFTGRSFDDEIGKYYYRARHYEEDDGRFQQKDPLGYFAGDMNLYSYVMNKPTRLVDPFGSDCHQPTLNSNIEKVKFDAYLKGYNFAKLGKFTQEQREEEFQETALAYIMELRRTKDPESLNLDWAAVDHYIFAKMGTGAGIAALGQDIFKLYLNIFSFYINTLSLDMINIDIKQITRQGSGKVSEPSFKAFKEGVKGGYLGIMGENQFGFSYKDFECRDKPMPKLKFYYKM